MFKQTTLDDFKNKLIPDAAIQIGFNFQDKNRIINEYIKNKKVEKVYIIFYKYFEYKYDIDIEYEYIEYSDTIEYEYFYRLLAEITDDVLIIIDECMRTSNINDLTYNCIHHFMNQTKHKLVFEYFPIISKQEDFLILMYYIDKSKFKGKKFNWGLLDQVNINIEPYDLEFKIENIDITEKQKERYISKAEKLFDDLGRKKDPDTIPRELQLYVGNMKKKWIEEHYIYVARNKRFQLDNVYSYHDLQEINDQNIKIDYIIDFHYRQINFNDFIKKFQIKKIKFLSTGLSIDKYHEDKFQTFLDNIKEFVRRCSG